MFSRAVRSPTSSHGASGSAWKVGVGLSLLLCAWLYFGLALRYPSTAFSRNGEGDYYSLLTSGFRSGHLYVALEPHPSLLTLADPYDPVANAPYRVHDMSLWKGKYYLYFGVTPVMVVFWPMKALTGVYPTEPFAVALFTFGAVVGSLAIFLALRRRYFPGAPGWVVVLGALCIEFANPLVLLNQGAQFYQVPISAASFFQALMLGALYRALHSPRRDWLWLGAASVAFGLTMGSRPNFIPGGFLLAIAVAWIGWLQPSARKRDFITQRNLVLATFGPAFAIGVGLLLYNWLRFGKASEFGMNYQLAGMKVMTQKPMSVANFVPHFTEYLFNAGTWGAYFPFLKLPAGVAIGALRYFPWLWLAPVALCASWLRREKAFVRFRPFALMLGLAVALNLGLISFFFGTTTLRYLCDFMPIWLLLGGVAALALTDHLRTARWVGALILAVGVFSLFAGFAAIGNGLREEGAVLRLARAANWPAYLWERATGFRYGGLHLELELPQGREGTSEPLFQTGYGQEERDWMLIEYLPENRARLGFYHAGLGLLQGRDFAIPANRRIVVDAKCGSLLPPFGHPLFSGWERENFEINQRDLWAKVDGIEVLHTTLECYYSPPNALRIGQLTWVSGGIGMRFTGRILGAERTEAPVIQAPPPVITTRTPVELTLLFPSDRQVGADPLLVTGKGKQSDLFYCIYEAPNKIRLALDHYGNGGPVSESLTFDSQQPQVVTVWLGSLATPGSKAPDETLWSERFVVLWNGKVVLNVPQAFYPTTPDTAVVAFNAQHSTAVGQRFSGQVMQVKQIDFAALPALDRQGEYGAVVMTAIFPRHVMGVADPLVVTGKTGAGNIVYVRYLDQQHLQFGFDHWGIGGIEGKPVEIDYAKPHRIEITLGSLYPPEAKPSLKTLVRVRMDGKTVLEGQSPTHPSRATEIRLGKNPIGGSTCGPFFNGQLLSTDRTAEPSP